MARIVYPGDVLRQIQLFDDLKTKHDHDGLSSKIRTYLEYKAIDLEAEAEVAADVAEWEKQRAAFNKSAENHKQRRDLLFEPVWKHTRDNYQFLKVLFNPEVKLLGEWGISVTSTGRLRFPVNFLARVEVVRLLKKKYDSIEPLTFNPLNVFLDQQHRSISDDWSDVEEALEENSKFKSDARETEKYTAKRNVAWKPVWEHVVGITNFLMKLFKGGEKELGLWGIRIDNSPKGHKTRKSTVNIAQSLLAKAIVLNGTFTNVGPTTLKVYKGRKITNEFSTVIPGESLAMTKGCSEILVINTSTQEKGKFKVLVYK